MKNIFILFSIAAMSSHLLASDAGRYKLAEDYVAKAVELGQVADLRNLVFLELRLVSDRDAISAEDYVAERTISGAFVEKLLAGSQNLNVHHCGIKIVNAVIDGQIDISTTVVSHETWFDNCIFKHSVDLYSCHFKKNLSISGSVFESKDCDFNNVRIDLNLIADNCKFAVAMFRKLSVGRAVTISESEFSGDVSFQHAQVGSYMMAEKTKFLSKDARFDLMEVGNTFALDGVEFKGAVTFSKTSVKKDFTFSNAKFLSPDDGSAKFDKVSVGLSLVLSKAVFCGGVDFSNVSIGGDIVADELVANCNGSTLFSFKEASVGGTVIFTGLEIGTYPDSPGARSIVDFSNSTLGDLELTGASKRGAYEAIEELNLSKSVIRGSLAVEGFRLARLKAFVVRVDGLATFANLKFDPSTAESKILEFNLEDSFFYSLLISYRLIQHRKDRNARVFRSSGLQYKHLRTRGTVSAHRLFLKFLEHSEFDPGAYLDLDRYLTKEGKVSESNKMMDQFRRKQRKNLKDGDFSQSIYHTYGRVTKYGRSPWRIVKYLVFWCLLGTVLFGPWFDPMEKKQKGSDADAPRYSFFSAFWFSLDVALPIIELEAENVWQIKRVNPYHRFLWHWSRVHKIIGWILVTVLFGVLASLFVF